MYLLLSLLSILTIIFSSTFSSVAIGAEPIINPVNGHYYQLVEVYPGLNWYEAKAAAETLEHNGMPGYLATITTSQEQNFVASSFPQILPEYVWLGATDEASEGVWQWITDEPWNYTNWAPGEPNGGTNQNCLDFADGSIQWDDEGCDRLINFYLVEYPGANVCVLDLTLTYSDSTLTIDFLAGTSVPATWNVWLSILNFTFPLWSVPIPAIDPPVDVPVPIPGFPNIGVVGVLTTLTTSEKGIICSDWETVDTGPIPNTEAVPTPGELKNLFKNFEVMPE